MVEPQPPATARDPGVEDLLESSWRGRGRTIRGRELRLELAVTAVFLLAVAALVVLAPSTPRLDPVAIAVVVAYAIAANAAFPIGAGSAVPTQLFLVPLFALVSAELVPGLVLAGLVLSNLGSAIAGRSRVDRVVTSGGDAMHAIGPALVFVVLSAGDATEAGPWVIGLAFAAQLGFDFVSSLLHDLVVFRVRPALHARVLAQVWGVDAALLPFGLLAGVAAQDSAWAALAPLPLVALLRELAADRSRRIAAAHDRLLALEHERARHQGAVKRIGDALASRLDLGALMEVVTRVAAEALDGQAGRGSAVGESALSTSPSAIAGDPANRTVALGLAEREALSSSQLAEVEDGGVHAVASPIGGPREPIGVVAVARSRPYSNEERSLLARLCQRAAVSADEALRLEQLRAAEARMRHQAFHDELTGLANRAMFVDRLEQALGSRAEGADQLAVLFIDLDGFKLANDMLGHEAGDELLVVIARRISTCIRPGDTAARFGGDEFAAILDDLERGPEAIEVAERLRRKLSEPISVRGREFVVHASIGVAFSGPGVEREQLLRNADLAMYAAKGDGGDRVACFKEEMLTRATTRIELATDLPGALADGDFELHFQPIVNLRDGEIHAVEALVRWRRSSGGVLAPGEFITAAEHTGVIEELGRFVLDEACRFATRELPPGVAAPKVSVNVSPVQLRDAEFVSDVIETIRRHGLAPERLIIESTAIENAAAIRVNLGELHRLGVTLALDDFGTGHASLSYLTQLPIDLLKLDQSFITEIDRDADQARLVGGMIALARSLDLSVVAEGIERPSQLDRVRDLGADLGQGYLLAEPMDEQSLIRWLDPSDELGKGSRPGDAPDPTSGLPQAPRKLSIVRGNG